MVSAGRATVTKLGYREYIQSEEWRKVRARYWASKLPKDCYCCGKRRQPGFHLHHRTYKNLGHEMLRDLVSVCPPCHEEIHALHRSDPRWRRKGLWFVTKEIKRRHG